MSEADARQRREEFRVPILDRTVTAGGTVTGGGAFRRKPFKTAVLDISLHGTFLAICPEFEGLKVGQRILVEFTGFGRSVKVPCIVRHINEAGVGVKVRTSPPEHRTLVTAAQRYFIRHRVDD